MKELDVREVFGKLGAPFPDEEIEWRATQVFEGRNGQPPKALVVPYVQSRAIQNRLDKVVGWDRWENLVCELPGGGIIQGIRIWVSDTRSITKWDGADRTNFEATKGGISGALKRAATLFNIGRYLYSYEAQWVEIKPSKTTNRDEYISDKKKNISRYFTPPKLGGSSNSSQQSSTKTPQPTPQTQKVPSGMIECLFKGYIEKHSNVGGPYLECWVEQNDEVAMILAIGKMREQLLDMNLKENDKIAINTDLDGNGQWLVNNIVKIA